MRAGQDDLYAELERAPEDWSVRIRLIEAAAAAGDLTEAKRLVRSSPDDGKYLPAELQDRIHSLILQAMQSGNPFSNLPQAEQ